MRKMGPLGLTDAGALLRQSPNSPTSARKSDHAGPYLESQERPKDGGPTIRQTCSGFPLHPSSSELVPV